jgi:hypothetical protein
MSLEQQLAELNTNVKALIAALGNSKPEVAAPKVEKPKAPSAPAADGAASGTSTPASTPAAAPSPALTYDDVKVPFLNLIKAKGRDAGLALLKGFGCEKLPDVKPEQFAEVKAAIDKALS